MKRKLSLLLALVMLITLIPVTPSHAATSNKIGNPKRVTPDSIIGLHDEVQPGGTVKTIPDDLWLTMKEDLALSPERGLKAGNRFDLNLEGDPIWNYRSDMTYYITDEHGTIVAVPRGTTSPTPSTPSGYRVLAQAGGTAAVDPLAKNTADNTKPVTVPFNQLMGKKVAVDIGGTKGAYDFTAATTNFEMQSIIRNLLVAVNGEAVDYDGLNLTVLKSGTDIVIGGAPAEPAEITFENTALENMTVRLTVDEGLASEKVTVRAFTDTSDVSSNFKDSNFSGATITTTGTKYTVKGDNSIKVEVMGASSGSTGNYETSALVKFERSSERSISAIILPGMEKTFESDLSKAYFNFPMRVNMNGAAAGDQKVNIVSRDRGVTDGSPVYAKVAESSILLSVDRVEKIARIGNNKVNLQLTEVEDGAFQKEGSVTLRLPINFKWRNVSVRMNNRELSTQIESDGRDLKIENLRTDDIKFVTDKVFINAEIEVLREAKQGKVDVTVKKGAYTAPRFLEIAQYVDDAVTVTAEKVLDVIAGKDIEGLYRAELYIEENVENALIDQRYMEFTFVNDKGESDGVKAYLQSGEQMLLEKLKGTADMDIKGDSNKVLAQQDGKNITVTEGHGRDGHTWDLKVTAGSGSAAATTPDKTKAKFKLTVPFVVTSSFTGDLYVNVKGAGVIGDAKNGGQMVKIASVKAPVTIKAEAPLAQVKIGLQTQMGSDIIVTETEAAALQDFIPASPSGSSISAYGGSNDYATYSVSPIPSSRRSWFIFDDAKVERTDGDISLDTNRSGVSGDEHGIDVVVDRVSTKASTIKISDVKLTLNRGVPYGDVQMGGFFGVVAHRHGHDKTPITNRVQKFDYIKTLTPVSDDKRISTIFKIGEAGYTTVIGGITEKHESDVAPYIENDRTMVPLRQIGESLGAIVNWDANTKTATFTRGQVVTVIPIQSSTMYINGSPRSLYAKPANVEGRILLPIVNASEAFGLEFGREVIWNADNKTVVILPQKATQAEIDDAQKVASKM